MLFFAKFYYLEAILRYYDVMNVKKMEYVPDLLI